MIVAPYVLFDGMFEGIVTEMLNLANGAQVAAIVQALFSVVIGIATVAVLIFNLKLNTRSLELAKQSQVLAKQSKQADLISEFNTRYSRTWEMRANDDVVNNPVVFYERFWSQQFDQFESWRRGFIPKDTFAYWTHCRYDDWVADKSLGSMTYKEGFNKTVATWKQSEFHKFIDILHVSGADAALTAFPAKTT